MSLVPDRHRIDTSARTSPRPTDGSRWMPWRLLAIFLLLAAAIIAIGWSAYRAEAGHLQRRESQQLQAIGDFKAGQIEEWLAERRRDAQVLAASPSLRDDFQGWLARPEDRSRDRLHGSLETLRLNDNYIAIELLDPAGRPRIAAGAVQHDLTAVPSVQLSEVKRITEPLFIDMHVDGTTGGIHFSYVQPIAGRRPGELVGYLRLSIDPNRHLYPLLKSWPTPSPSAETLIVRKDGNDALFLNDLRHRPGAALNFRIPLAREDLPAVAALRHDRQLFRGRDYRGVPVLAYLRSVAGTPWAMVTKVDEAEIFHDSRQVAYWSLAAVLAAIAVSGLFLWQFWRRQQLRERVRVAEAVRESREDLERAQAVARTGSWRIDVEGKALHWSLEAHRIFGIPPGTPLTYDTFLAAVHPEDREYVDRMWQAALQGAPYDLVHRVVADGQVKWVRERGELEVDREGRLVGGYGSCQDVTELQAVQAALRSSEARLALFIENAPVALAMVDREMRYLAVSRRWRTDYCLEGRDLAGVCHYDALDIPDAWKLNHRRALAGATVSNSGDPLDLADGSRKWIRSEIHPWHDSAGEVGGLIIFTEDITAAKAAETALLESRQRFAGIVESAMDGIISIDEGQRVVLFNAAAERIFGYRAEDMVGAPIDRLIPESLRARHAGHVRRFEASGTTSRAKDGHSTLTGLRSDGSEFPMEASISQITVGGRKLFTVILRDVTERVRAQEEIHRLNADLERRVEERTAELAAANDALMRSNLELQRFAHVAAHDLQTPLRSIAGFAQLLQKLHPTGGDDQADEWIAQVVDNTKRMQTLIQDLLTYSRLESQSRPWVMTDFAQLFCEVREGLDSTIRETGAEVTCGELPVVMVDRTQMAQVLQNLIENGIKYNRAQPARVHVSAERRGDEWLFSVSDNGIGVDPKYHQRIFEAFRRLHSYHEYPGTGIGLAVCQRVVERHGGGIWVESPDGGGSVFHFTIPVRAASSQ
ncbi:MAG TPA: PAS domain S-box protein [Rhodocyclaceae bacterium]|nr:PAS domain S-box protein [Rhodocyclaceae bacterium]